MTQRYVVVADNARARVYLYDRKGKSLEEQYDMYYPEGRQKDQDIYSDRPGRQRAEAGGGRHAMGRDNVTRDHEAAVFAREVARRLEDDRTRNRFDDLTLIAPPHFMGELRKHLTGPCRDSVSRSIDKDLSKSREEEIVEHLESDESP